MSLPKKALVIVFSVLIIMGAMPAEVSLSIEEASMSMAEVSMSRAAEASSITAVKPAPVKSQLSMNVQGGGMNANNNVVLAFAKECGFDVDAYIESKDAWKVVGSKYDGYYGTSVGKATQNNALTYGVGAITYVGLGTLPVNLNSIGDIWEAEKKSVTRLGGSAGNWNDYIKWMKSNDGDLYSNGSVECAGLVNLFFGYLKTHLYQEDSWSLYYDAYNWGVVNNAWGYPNGSGTSYNLNNVSTAISGIHGMAQYQDPNAVLWYETATTHKTDPEHWEDVLDSMSPGAVLTFVHGYQLNEFNVQHTGLYIGKANGLHWMFHTNTTDYNARITPIEYYSKTWKEGSGDMGDKGDVYMYKVGGIKISDNPGFARLTKKVNVSSAQRKEDPDIDSKISGKYKFRIYHESGEETVSPSSTEFVINISEGEVTGASTARLDAGNYYAIEYQAPPGIVLNETPISFTVTSDNTEEKPVEISETNHLKRQVKIKKTSANSSITNNNRCYDMTGIMFNVFDNQNCKGEPVGLLKITSYDREKSIGVTPVIYLEDGEYWIKEDSESVIGTGFKADNSVKPIVVNSNTSPEVIVVEFSDEPGFSPINLLLEKVANVNGIICTKAAVPPLDGARFDVKYYDGIYTQASDAEKGGEPLCAYVFSSKHNSQTNKGEVKLLDSYKESGSKLYKKHTNGFPIGTLVIKELEAPKGYIESDDIYVCNMTFDEKESKGRWTIYNGKTGKKLSETDAFSTDTTLDIPLDIENRVIFSGVKFGKLDSELNQNIPQGDASLRGAEFTIYNNTGKEIVLSDCSTVGAGSAIPKTKGGTLISDEKGVCTSGKKLLPIGKYYVKETKAPEGYNINNDWRIDFEITDTVPGNEQILDLSQEENKVKDDIIRADLRFFKVDIDGKSQSLVPFLIERLDDDDQVVESHVILTDEQGYCDTSKRHKTPDNLNILDEFVSNGEYTGPLDEEAAKANVWFGIEQKASNGRGSLLYDTYRVTELKSENSTGNPVLKQVVVTRDELIAAFIEGKTFNLDNIFVNLLVHPESSLIDDSSETKIASIKKKSDITDSVRWNHLKVGQEYELETVLFYTSRDGREEKELGRKSVRFTPQKVDSTNTSHGIEKNTLTIDTSMLNGGRIHAVDYIYAHNDGNRILIVSHNEEKNIEEQMLAVPYMETTASDTNTGDHVGTVGAKASIKDVIVYENLPDERMFIVKEEIVDRDKPKEVLGSAERIIRVSKRRTESKESKGGILLVPTSGKIEMPEISLDTSSYGGKTLVVYESLIDYDTGETYLVHSDTLDEKQSIHYIQVRTLAWDEETGTHTGNVTEKNKIIDEVSIENAIPGMEYVITGKLVRKDTMKVVSESTPKTVVAEEPNFKERIEFELDSSSLSGISCVAYEYVSHNDVQVAKHEDPDDENQTINYPRVKTTAVDKNTGMHTSIVGKTTIVDRVKLSNLSKGEEYKVVGTLMKGDGSEFNKEPVESEIFTAIKSDMTIELEFPVDTEKLAGQHLVVFEKLMMVAKDEAEVKVIEVARHEDIKDNGQTVRIPEISTNAMDSKTRTDVGTVGDEETIIDRVTYKNLVPGETYTIKGNLHYLNDGVNHKAGDVVKDKKGKVITAVETFVPEKESGYIDLYYKLDSELLRGESVVVFEDLYSNDIKVCSHADLGDRDQRIDYPDILTKASDKSDGDSIIPNSGLNTIIDTVSYKNLKPGTYTVVLTVMDKSTGRAVRSNVSNDVVTKTEQVEIKAPEGGFQVEIGLNYHITSGKTLVMFEDLYMNGKCIVGHRDLSDEAQTIYAPELNTTLNSGRKKEAAPSGSTKLVDKVEYNNLEAGKNYTLMGYLVDKENGRIVAESEAVAFVPKRNSGSVKVPFTLDTSKMAGKSLVAFETLTYTEDDKTYLVCEHKDINAKEQTIEIIKQPEKPRTGDENDYVSYMALIMLALSCGLLTALRIRS